MLLFAARPLAFMRLPGRVASDPLIPWNPREPSGSHCATMSRRKNVSSHFLNSPMSSSAHQSSEHRSSSLSPWAQAPANGLARFAQEDYICGRTTPDARIQETTKLNVCGAPNTAPPASDFP